MTNTLYRRIRIQLLLVCLMVWAGLLSPAARAASAAAATAVVMATKSVVRDHPVFRADRPFLFMIREVASGSILFLGRCADPR